VLVWLCDVCSEPIADDDGYLTMSYAELREHERAVRAWEERIALAYPGPWRAYPMSELADYPVPVRWRMLHHRGCDPDPESSDYWIPVSRIRTPAAVIHWTAHLLEKRWLTSTTWRDLLRRVAGDLGEPA
jgi:hypothetical protein